MLLDIWMINGVYCGSLCSVSILCFYFCVIFKEQTVNTPILPMLRVALDCYGLFVCVSSGLDAILPFLRSFLPSLCISKPIYTVAKIGLARMNISKVLVTFHPCLVTCSEKKDKLHVYLNEVLKPNTWQGKEG